MPNVLGIRLRVLREELGLSQEALAKSLKLSAEFISLLELGKRTPSLDSLKKIAQFFQKDVTYFLGAKGTPKEKLLERAGEDKKFKSGLNKFYKLCRGYLDLEGKLGLKPELAPLYTTASAESMAHEERLRLGLGSEPIKDIFGLLERNGLHLIRHPLHEEWNISGIFIFFELEQSAFALLNSLYPIGHQAFIAAHEYFHYLKDRTVGLIIDNHDVFVSEYLPLYHPREKLAHSFAVRFLMPREKVEAIIHREFPSTKLSFHDVLYLKRYFGVSTMAMLYALQDYGCLSVSQFKEFQRRETSEYEKDIFGSLGSDEEGQRAKKKAWVSDRFKWLIVEAYRKKKIDDDKACRVLKLDKKQLSKITKT